MFSNPPQLAICQAKGGLEEADVDAEHIVADAGNLLDDQLTIVHPESSLQGQAQNSRQLQIILNQTHQSTPVNHQQPVAHQQAYRQVQLTQKVTTEQLQAHYSPVVFPQRQQQQLQIAQSLPVHVLYQQKQPYELNVYQVHKLQQHTSPQQVQTTMQPIGASLQLLEQQSDFLSLSPTIEFPNISQVS